MKPLFVAAVAGSLMLFGCNQQQQAAAPAAAPAGAAAEGAYSATGTLTVVNNDTVMVDSSPVAELDWPAMNMTYIVPNADMVKDLKPGEPVRFSFRQNGFGYELTSIQKQ